MGDKCHICGRTFDSGRLEIHLRSCAKNPHRSVTDPVRRGPYNPARVYNPDDDALNKQQSLLSNKRGSIEYRSKSPANITRNNKYDNLKIKKNNNENEIYHGNLIIDNKKVTNINTTRNKSPSISIKNKYYDDESLNVSKS